MMSERVAFQRELVLILQVIQASNKLQIDAAANTFDAEFAFLAFLEIDDLVYGGKSDKGFSVNVVVAHKDRQFYHV